MTECAGMAHRYRDGVLYAPEGFLILAMTGEVLNAVHIESRKVARVSPVCMKADGSVNGVQRELDRECAKLLREMDK